MRKPKKMPINPIPDEAVCYIRQGAKQYKLIYEIEELDEDSFYMYIGDTKTLEMAVVLREFKDKLLVKMIRTSNVVGVDGNAVLSI